MELKQKIASIQHTVEGLSKEANNPFFKSKYVDLNTIIEALRPLEAEQSISITMPLSNVAGRPAIRLVVQDLDSDDMTEDIITLPDISDPQKMGSAITYYRRYMLMSFFNIKAEDDDSNFASGKTTQPLSKPTYKTTNEEI
jgi:hypothetical protein